MLARCVVDGDCCAMLLLAPAGRSVWQTFQAPLGVCVYRKGIDWANCLAALIKQLPALATLQA